MNKNDLRYVKTEANLKQAFLALLATEDCSGITVSQLCQQAQCARNTFYQHYDSLEALRTGVIAQILTGIGAAFRPTGETLAEIKGDQVRLYVQHIITAVDTQRAALTILLAKDDGAFQKQLVDVIVQQVLAGDRGLSQVADTAVNRLNVAYMAWAVAGFVARWLNEPSITPEQACDLFFQLHQPTISTNVAYLATAPR
ncbi:TetR/AcrR family transcriptional regulator [Lacticaseibacillus nasuensis]|uniref:TetR/AcrR family transcriptional regulator n=1 Tax=Lacticaseibacillus nasuensis TaxID=944671 RepID=UPI0022479911|nr:TetR/AcrR family transcriptional regulator [Lacticaseibacillus nasuensis]MCX2455088.1 TetR/AcrR family transcriptional regulator [Lacticaseibacillus nasuensis]